MTDPFLDTARRALELAEAAAAHTETDERASTTQERDSLRQVARDLAAAAQIVANSLETHARGGSRKDRAPSPGLFALREAILHLVHLLEQRAAADAKAAEPPVNDS